MITSSVLIIVFIAIGGLLHLHQEAAQGFDVFQNEHIFGSKTHGHPVGRLKARWVDGIGLGVIILGLSGVSIWYSSPFFLAVLLGHVGADSVQHFGHWTWFRGRMRTVPGWTTTAYGLIPGFAAGMWVLWSSGGLEKDGIAYAFGAGSSLVVGSFILGHVRVWLASR